ncbi:hypothetical protein QX204_03545 [Nocardia sp. PE-7]|uniref:hypothetical protein n=1 Tax=Nocardia sp. PE-7 TaxID=3058426 RepID=UPI00265B0ED9|nr:hypothetical protein [Nocardia sp. PE-7]WKG10585.1 hypothetical protein QX204_03545 [Nocardia sp. PE-7]
MFAQDRNEAKLLRIERKLDLIMRHLEITDPASELDLSEVDDLVRQGKKIQAIRAYRQLRPDASLVEARDVVEARDADR